MDLRDRLAAFAKAALKAAGANQQNFPKMKAQVGAGAALPNGRTRKEDRNHAKIAHIDPAVIDKRKTWGKMNNLNHEIMIAKLRSGKLVRNFPWSTEEASLWRCRHGLHQTFIQSIDIGVVSEGLLFASKAAAGNAAAAAAALAALAVFEQPEPTIISTPQPSEEQVDWDPEITTTEEPAVAEPSRPEETRPDRSEPQEGQEPKLQSKVATEHPPRAQ